MSYSEENGDVVLRMSREDYRRVILALGYARSWMQSTQNRGDIDGLVNRLNSRNPNYTPYQVEK